MFLLVRTITITIDDVEVSMRLYHTVQAYVDHEKIKFRVLGGKIEKVLHKKNFKKKILCKKNIHSVFSAKQILEAFRIDTNVVSHSHVRTQVSSPGKVDSNMLVDGGMEKRSPGPLTSDCSSGGQLLQLSPESNSQQTAQWLRKNSFGNYVSTFANFSGADILRLTRDDLIQICGLADGIRLLYALHSQAIVRLTLYICTSTSAVYHAVYLYHVSRNEMSRKLAALLGVHQNQIQDIFLQGPNDIRVLITDEVVSNIKDESVFSVEVLKDEPRGRFILLLKPGHSPT